MFPDVRGLKEGAAVRVAGVEAGQVAAVEFSGSGVRVTLELNQDVRPRVTTESVASLGSASLLGEPMIDLTASTKGKPLADGALIPSVYGSAQLADVAASAAESLEQVTALVRDIRGGEGTVGRLFTDEELYREARSLVGAIEDVASQIQGGEGTLGRLVTDPSAYRKLDAALTNLQRITGPIAAGKGSLGRLVPDKTFATSITAAAANVRELTSSIQRGKGQSDS